MKVMLTMMLWISHQRSLEWYEQSTRRVGVLASLCFTWWYWWLNSLWPSDTIWRHKSGSTLAQVMACCLKAPSHYLNQCWFIISEVQWHPSESKIPQPSVTEISLKITNCPACRTTLVATRFRVAVICPIIQVPHCIRVFFYFVWFVFINHIFQFYYELCTYCNILDIYLS